MRRAEVRELLLAAADSGYKEFNDRITNCDAAPSIGIRVPRLREIAGELVKHDWEAYLEEMEQADAGTLFQEEHMLQGMVIGRAKMEQERRVFHLDRWIPGVLSWADCDCCVSGFKFMKKNQDFWFDYCGKWLKSQREFELRVAIVALMQYFIHEEYIDQVLEILRGTYPAVPSETGEGQQAADAPYYVKMAQAWALSVCFVKFRDRTWELLARQCMDPWIQNKAIQKCRESYRVSKEDKELLKSLKMQERA